MPKLSVTIEKLDSNGFGMARVEGKIYFVPWALPGDRVEIEVEKDHAQYGEARLLTVLEKSPDRTEAPCLYFLDCGGCTLQHLQYMAQLRWKKVMVEDALIKHARLALKVEDVMASPEILHYRNRIQLHQNKSGQWGFYRQNSHEVIEIKQCLIAEENLNTQILKLKKNQASPAKTIELRSRQAGGFAQVNTSQNKILIQKVIELLNPQKTDLIADVFCGAGNFAIPLASKVSRIIGIEKVREALEEAGKKMKAEGISNIQWRQGPAAQLLRQCLQEDLKFDALILDPPRTGLDDALKFVIKLKAPRIVYVSCAPSTFARDTQELCANGYTLEVIQPLDMFPHTPHVEIVGLFTLAA